MSERSATARAVEILPSILAADFTRLGEEVAAVVAAGVTTVQVDVMDGAFVPNISVGLPVVRSLSEHTDARLDVHLMVQQPERFIDDFAAAGADVLTVHAEATPHLHRALARIRTLGVAAGAAVNPATPLTALDEVLGLIDVALVMTVDPGFGGQSFIRATLPKIRRLRRRIDECGLDVALQVDGGIDPTTIADAVAAGATQLVAGSAVFRADVPPGEAVRRLRRAASRQPT